jgi:hypothetical protein
MPTHRALLTLALAAAATASMPAAKSMAGTAQGETQALSGDIGTGFAGTGVVVSADTDKSDASITLSRSKDFQSSDGNRAGFNSWTIKGSTPLTGKDKTTANFITDEGLPGSYSVELAFTRVTVPYIQGPDPDSLNGKGKIPLPPSTGEAHWLTALTLSGGIGRKGHDFRDPASPTLAKQSVDKTAYHFGGQFGGLYGHAGSPFDGWFIGAGGEYKVDYTDPDSQTLCTPPPATGAQECFTGPFGAPVRKPEATGYLLLRKSTFLSAFDVPVGVQLKPAYDFENKVGGLEATLFFLPSGDAGLQGGVRVKLQTKDNDPKTKDKTATVGLFVGAAF